MMLLRILVALALSMAWAVWAEAFTCTPTGCTFTVSYTEPTTNTAGGPPQLTSTTIAYTVSGGAEKTVLVPASSANGGAVVSRQITEAIVPGTVGAISAQAFATNPAGNSVRTAAVTLTINRAGEVIDNAPTGLTIQ